MKFLPLVVQQLYTTRASWEVISRREAVEGHTGPWAKEIQIGAEKGTAPQTR